MLLAAVTKLLIHFQDFGLEVITSVTTTLLLTRAIGSLNNHTERTVQERFFVDVPIGLFAGWMLIFSATTIFTALASWNLLDLLWIPEIVWAIRLVLLVLVVLSKLTLTGQIGRAHG